MISPELLRSIEKEGKKKGFKIRSAGGDYDNDGKFIFVITLEPTIEDKPPDLGVKVNDDIGAELKRGE